MSSEATQTYGRLKGKVAIVTGMLPLLLGIIQPYSIPTMELPPFPYIRIHLLTFSQVHLPATAWASL